MTTWSAGRCKVNKARWCVFDGEQRHIHVNSMNDAGALAAQFEAHYIQMGVVKGMYARLRALFDEQATEYRMFAEAVIWDGAKEADERRLLVAICEGLLSDDEAFIEEAAAAYSELFVTDSELPPETLIETIAN